MSITFQCGGCGKRYQVDEAMAGKKVRCKACSEVTAVPAAAPKPKAKAKPALRSFEGQGAAPPKPKPKAAGTRPAAPKPASRAIDDDDNDPYADLANPYADVESSREAELSDAADGPMLTRSSRGKQQSGKKGGAGGGPSGQTIGIIAGVAAGVVILFLVVVLLVRAGSGSAGDDSLTKHRELTDRGIQSVERLAGLLAEVNDEESARRIAPMAAQEAIEISQLARQLAMLPTPRGDEAAEFERLIGGRRDQALEDLRMQVRRIRSVPGASSELGGVALAASR